MHHDSDDDDCDMCDGCGEVDAPKVEEYGSLPCPDCVSRDARVARINLLARACAIAERECIEAGNPALGAKIDDLISKLIDA